MNSRIIACQNTNEKERLNSSSGGIFPLLARHILKQGGVVYGAAFSLDFSIEHIRICREIEIERLVGSKYAYSKIGSHIFPSVEKDLQAGKKVMFVGTPCQVKGLRMYLKTDNSNLLTVDFICHGAPAQSTWKRYLDEISLEKRIKRINLRDKRKGWIDYHVVIEFEDGSSYICEHSMDPYISGLVCNLILREACYHCKNIGIDSRRSDITLGDLWKAENLVPELFDNKGTSIIMLHNEKGVDYFEQIKPNVDIAEVDYKKAIEVNPSAVKPASKNPLYNLFQNDLKKGYSLIDCLNKYTHPMFAHKCLFKAYKCLMGYRTK